MNILEPLYEICITRMQEFQAENKNLFKEELGEISNKYRSNIQYFIFKSIILRNLYGVDIMAEAIEIAKLRLFLKMVAVVDVDMRADNLGLDPLPDIDFNIRCGNTLVGYATEKQLEDSITFGDMFARRDFKERIQQKLDIVSKTYDTFKWLQMNQQDNREAFKEAKRQLHDKLASLNEDLNQHLYGHKPDLGYATWLDRTQPFHWVAEFYEIMHNGGFDVIIGNPPYVETTNIDYNIDFCQNNYANLYAYCLIRCTDICKSCSYNGLIVPMSITSIRDYQLLRNNFFNKEKLSYLTNHSIRPTSLFNGVSQRVSIVLFTNNTDDRILYTTKYIRSFDHKVLFETLQYFEGAIEKDRGWIIPKIDNRIAASVYYKINQKTKDLGGCFHSNATGELYFKDYGETYWIFPYDFNPMLTPVKSFKVKKVDEAYLDRMFMALNSSTFYIYYTEISDCWHFGTWHINEFPISISDLQKSNLSEKLSNSYKQNRIIRYDKRAGGDIYEYKVKKSKPIIDEIDKVLAKHYGFNDEELDFIINYDIKYRMGDELNE